MSDLPTSGPAVPTNSDDAVASKAAAPSLAQVVRAALATRYAAPVMRTSRPGASEVHEGPGARAPKAPAHVAVLDGKPLALAREAVQAAGLGDPAELVSAIDVATLDWWAVPGEGLQLWRQHGRSGSEGELVTELAAGDPAFQIISELDGWQLVRALDGATGWIRGWLNDDEPAFIEAAAPDAATSERPIDATGFADAAEQLLGVPYVWGGTTQAGIDCSGLAQRAAWQASARWLPRHSTALLRVGERVARAGIERGDVLVLRRDMTQLPAGQQDRHPMHVAIAVSSDDAVHASRDDWAVVRESIAQLAERYKILSIRRLSA